MSEHQAREAALAKAMEGECCVKCKFGQDAGHVINCRRNPPQVAPLSWVTKPEPKSGGGITEVINLGAHFPQMAKEGWCGEFRLRIVGLN